MKLSKAAQMFNKTKFFDAYTGEKLGVGQLDVYDDSKRDGLTAQRRVFEVAPGLAMPGRMAIEFHGYQWLVGVVEPDSYRGEIIREKYVLHQSEGLAQTSTLKQTLNGSAPHKAYAARVWTKTTAEVEISSGKFNQLQIFFSRAEDIKTDMLIKVGDKTHTVLSVHPASAGHLAAVAEELNEGAVTVGTVTTKGDWDHNTESYPEVTVSVPLVKLRWQSDFAYLSQATEDFKRGDMQVVTLEAHGTGTGININDEAWKVMASQPRNDVHYLHLRRA